MGKDKGQDQERKKETGMQQKGMRKAGDKWERQIRGEESRSREIKAEGT